MKPVIRIILADLAVLPVLFISARAEIRIVADIRGDSAYADSVIKVTAARLDRLIGPVPDEYLEVHIVASQGRFDSLSGGALPDWGAGVAIPYRRLIVIKSPLITPGDKSLGELVAHEITHVALARRLNFQPVPRWLDEGMAMYLSAEWSWDDNVALGVAVVMGHELALADIEYLNRFNARRAQVAYSMSFLAFKYFLDTYGETGLRLLLDDYQAGRSSDYAFIDAIGADYRSFQQEYASFLRGRYTVVTLLFDSNLLWILLALILVVGFIIVRWRRKRRIAEMDAYDKYHSTDFDYGEVEKPDEDEPWR